jgi:hypothetical protein
MSTPDPEIVNLKKLRPGPIRNESLPAELLEQIRAVYDAIGPFLGTTLEQFEIDFMRDMHPEDEIAVWCSIIAAWIAYHKTHLRNEMLSEEDEKKLLAALIAISSGVEDVEKLGVPADVGRKLLACYDERLPEPPVSTQANGTIEPTILTHPYCGINVLGMLWLFIGVFPTSIAVATLEPPRMFAGMLLVSGVVASILLDVWWRFRSEPAGDWQRFFRPLSGGCLLWIPYWLSWFVLIPIVFVISRR